MLLYREEKENSSQFYLSKSEILEIIKILSRKNYEHLLWFKFLYSFGISCRDLVELRVKDILVRSKKIKFKTQSGRSRILNIPSLLLNDLRLLLNHKKKANDFVFTVKNKKLKLRTVQAFLEKLSILKGRKINSSILRRSLIQHFWEEGWTRKQIRIFFGDSCVRVVRSVVKSG
jgi:site-specific recombinase XerD